MLHRQNLFFPSRRVLQKLRFLCFLSDKTNMFSGISYHKYFIMRQFSIQPPLHSYRLSIISLSLPSLRSALASSTPQKTIITHQKYSVFWITISNFNYKSENFPKYIFFFQQKFVCQHEYEFFKKIHLIDMFFEGASACKNAWNVSKSIRIHRWKNVVLTVVILHNTHKIPFINNSL